MKTSFGFDLKHGETEYKIGEHIIVSSEKEAMILLGDSGGGRYTITNRSSNPGHWMNKLMTCIGDSYVTGEDAIEYLSAIGWDDNTTRKALSLVRRYIYGQGMKKLPSYMLR